MIFVHLLYNAGRIWLKAGAEHASAAMAYYIPFALAPMLLISISIVGVVSGTERVSVLLYGWGAAIDPELAAVMSTAVQNLDRLTGQFAIPVLAILFFSGMIFVTINYLALMVNKISGVSVKGWWNYFRLLSRSLLFMIVIQAYILFVIILEEIAELVSVVGVIGGNVLKTPVLLMSTALLCLFGYSILSLRPASLRARAYASLVVTGLFMVSGFLVSLHLATAPIPDLFGAAGTIIIFLIWLYVTATIIFFGVAFARAYDEWRSGRVMAASSLPHNFR